MTYNTSPSNKPRPRDVVFTNGALPESAAVSLDGLPRKAHHQVLYCSSGRRLEGDWTGVPLAALVATVNVPDETTHLLVESAEGYVACIALTDLGDAVLALTERRRDCEGTEDVTPRIVGPSIDARRSVKQVTRIVATSLQPGDDPTEYEHLPTSTSNATPSS